jgi:hypothetical protein
VTLISELKTETFRTLLEEVDEKKFENNLSNFLEECRENKDLESFGNYFNNYYAKRKELWAFCYRKGAMLNTNMRIESFHRTFKHDYANGKAMSRIDKCLFMLVRYVRDKIIIGMLIKEKKGKG